MKKREREREHSVRWRKKMEILMIYAYKTEQ